MHKLTTLVLVLYIFIGNANEINNHDRLLSNKIEKQTITENEVVEAVKAINNALVNPNQELLKSLTFDNLTYGHSGGNIQNRNEFIDDLLNGPFDFLEIYTSKEQIEISGETAIARHIMTAKGTNSEGPVDVHIGIILVFKKQNGKLKLLARQAYKL